MSIFKILKITPVLFLTSSAWGMTKEMPAKYEVPTMDQELMPYATIPMKNAVINEPESGPAMVTYTLPKELTGEELSSTFMQDESVKDLMYFTSDKGAVSCTENWKNMSCVVQWKNLNIDRAKVNKHLSANYTGDKLKALEQLSLKFDVEPIGFIKGAMSMPSGKNAGEAIPVTIDKVRNGTFAENAVDTQKWFKVDLNRPVDIELFFKGNQSEQGLPDLDFSIYDSNQKLIKEAITFDEEKEVLPNFRTSNPGTHYIVINNPFYTGAISFKLVVRRK